MWQEIGSEKSGTEGREIGAIPHSHSPFMLSITFNL